MTEQWLAVFGVESKYSVSNQGRVRNDVLGTILHGSLNAKGYRQVTLYRENGKIWVRLAHIMVLEAFVSPRPPGMRGLHWDDDGDNNILSNLRWGTASDNMQDMIRNGLHAQVNKTECSRGHAYDELNTYRVPSTGKRHCRKCKIDEQRKRLNQKPRVSTR